jgi:hypothetical protein
MTWQSAGTSLPQALASWTSWPILPVATGLTAWGRPRASWLFPLRTIGYVERSNKLKSEATRLLEEALIRGEFERGEISRITGLPERTARRVLNDLTSLGLLASDTSKGAVSLRFPIDALDILFPRLFPET